ncbi:MAG: DHHA1 domain-containing protein [Planctomycetota bacterium]
MRNVALLTAEDEASAQTILDEIVAENEERKKLSHLLTEDLIAEAEALENISELGALVFAGEGWHPGVIGIVASRLSDRFAKPSCVIAINDGQGKGSMRSAAGCHLGEVINACRDTLLGGGGHAAAAGISIDPQRIDDFRAAFETYIHSAHPDGLDGPSVDHDGSARICDLNDAFFADLDRMEPFGTANPSPSFIIEQACSVGKLQLFGRDGNHLRGGITDPSGGILQLLAWRGRDLFEELNRPGSSHDLLVAPENNRWRGQRQARLRFLDGRTRS